ncbi:MAG: hypothetical protein WBM32_04695 [Crocosphaera sp.]|jgi:hypothetical protein
MTNRTEEKNKSFSQSTTYDGSFLENTPYPVSGIVLILELAITKIS